MSHDGRLLVHPAAARTLFRELAARPDDRLDLTEAALIIALEEYPALEMDLGAEAERSGLARLTGQDGLQSPDRLVGPAQGEEAFGERRGDPRIARPFLRHRAEVIPRIVQPTREELRLGESETDVAV